MVVKCKIDHTVHFTLVTDCAMDHVLNIADHYIFTPYVYPASWPEDGALRQIISLWVVTNLGAVLIYLGFGALNFYYVFDHKLMKHPHFMKVSCLMGRPVKGQEMIGGVNYWGLGLFLLLKITPDNNSKANFSQILTLCLIQQQNQVRREIQLSTVSIFWMSFPTVAFFFWEIKGNSKLYDNISDSSLGETTVT